jgi:hypothetical protein
MSRLPFAARLGLAFFASALTAHLFLFRRAKRRLGL